MWAAYFQGQGACFVTLTWSDVGLPASASILRSSSLSPNKTEQPPSHHRQFCGSHQRHPIVIRPATNALEAPPHIPGRCPGSWPCCEARREGAGRLGKTARPKPHEHNRFYGCKPQTTFATRPTLCFTITPPRDTSTHTTIGKWRAGGVVQQLAAAGRACIGWTPGRENKLLVVVCPQPKANTRHLDACPRRTPPPACSSTPTRSLGFVVWTRTLVAAFGLVGWTVLP